MRDVLQADARKTAYRGSSMEAVAMSSRSPMNHDPYEHFATREALAEVATRLDATLPHLATKADVERMGNRLLFWLTGTLVTCLLAFYGLHSRLLESQEAQVRLLQAEMRTNSHAQDEIRAQLALMAREQQRVAEQLERLASQRDEKGQRRP
jgi:hypothetical protein